jgi:TonB family protein
MNCPYCNSDLASGVKFCPKCGNSIPDQMNESHSKSGGGGLIAALLIVLFVAGVGVISYLYFFAEPKRTEPENKIVEDPASPKPVDKDQEVPMPDAGSSQSSQPEQKQEVSQPATESPEQQKQEVPEPQDEKTSNPISQDTKTSDPMRITADVVQPVLIKRVNPEYPEIARKSRVQGIIILEAIITREGTVEKVKVLRGVHPLLDQAAVNAVKQWRYKPATLNGKPVKVYSTITVNFKLK